jgi:drug/metabolite transporter (DMT)-like permease
MRQTNKHTEINVSTALLSRSYNKLNHQYSSVESELCPIVLAVSSGGETDESDDGTPKFAKGRALLCLVALLYGTLNVSLRFVYQLDAPPSAAALSATRGWLASLCFVPLLSFKKFKAQKKKASPASPSTAIVSSLSPSPSPKSLLFAGSELAVWNFLAQGLLNVGLLSTGSARAAFLTQMSVVMTPVISLLVGQSVAPTVWIGCAVALGGLTLLSGAGGVAGSTMLAFSTGDLLVIGCALTWSIYLLRLSKIGSKFDEINLQAVKTNVIAVLNSLWLAVSVWQNPAASSWGWVTSSTAWLALFYSALGPGMVADILQTKGQKDVSASEGKWL